jgi:hypothetical protein
MKKVNLFNRAAHLSLMVAVTLSTATMTSCTPEEEEEPTPTQTVPPTPMPADGNGVLAAIVIRTTQTIQIPGMPDQVVNVDMGVGSAFFYENGNTSTFLDAGTVTLTNQDLTKQTNNSYLYMPSGTDVTGIDFDADGVSWNVTGAGSIPAFSKNLGNAFPNADAVTSGSTVTKASGYTLTASNVSGADSVYFQVHDVVVAQPNNTSSYTFTAAELANVPAGPSIVQVVAMKITSEMVSGKMMYYVKETSVSKNITVE